MKIRHATDLHLEFFEDPNLKNLANTLLPPLPNDKETVLLLTGDIGSSSRKNTVAKKFYEFFEVLNDRFLKVLWVFGNHEFYKGNLDREVDKSKEVLEVLENIFILDNEVFYLNGFAFVGTTLWSDIKGVSEYNMNDTKLIRQKKGNRYTKLNQNRLQVEFSKNVFFLNETLRLLEENNDVHTIVVLSHHSPSFRSFHGSKYAKIDDVSKAYASNLEYLMAYGKLKLWFHGHLHIKSDYLINGTNVISNPHGYVIEEYQQGEYNDKFFIEIKEKDGF